MKDTTSAITDLNEYMSNLFGGYELTGERQQILAGLFRWLKENDYHPMSAGEVRTAMRKGFPELLENDLSWLTGENNQKG